jgi:hypothetical protein
MYINAIPASGSCGDQVVTFGVCGMALEALKAEIALLLEMFANAPHDRYELYIQLKEKLNEMRVFGMTPPDDLLQLEGELDREFAAEQHARATPPSP